MRGPHWIDCAARGVARWARSHPDAAGPGGPGDSNATALVVAAVLWFCATLAIGALIGGVVASAGEPAAPADVDWGEMVSVAIAWVVFLNVPVWALAAHRWRQRRDA